MAVAPQLVPGQTALASCGNWHEIARPRQTLRCMQLILRLWSELCACVCWFEAILTFNCTPTICCRDVLAAGSTPLGAQCRPQPLHCKKQAQPS